MMFIGIFIFTLHIHVLTVALLFQAILALFRCSPESSYRPVFNWLHWFFGTVGYVLSSKLLGRSAKVNLLSSVFHLFLSSPGFVCSVFRLAICYTQSNKLLSDEVTWLECSWLVFIFEFYALHLWIQAFAGER